MLHFAATAIASEQLVKHELCHGAERLALTREQTEQLTLLKRELRKILKPFLPHWLWIVVFWACQSFSKTSSLSESSLFASENIVTIFIPADV